MYWLHKHKKYIYDCIKCLRKKEENSGTKVNGTKSVWVGWCCVVYPAHISWTKSISSILLQIHHRTISDGSITAYKWMNHNWSNPLLFHNWEIIELFPCLILSAVMVLNSFVHKFHPPPERFYTPGLLMIRMSCPLLISLSGMLHNQ